ncbi:hypothetical protein GWI33_000215 [Rhynchophorus ferrugineus]|uniref:Uncharacterized protein n=1 Tax=Rhynchophorus ferrugineus TaxID=354439 RepID=A0A834IVP9_RHYFE|nr:hypothetical protein GWI33_000215 [Rhynchophorus ferrugineus]
MESRRRDENSVRFVALWQIRADYSLIGHFSGKLISLGFLWGQENKTKPTELSNTATQSTEELSQFLTIKVDNRRTKLAVIINSQTNLTPRDETEQSTARDHRISPFSGSEVDAKKKLKNHQGHREKSFGSDVREVTPTKGIRCIG